MMANSAPSADTAVVLRAEQITKRYPGTIALDRVDFNIYRGKVNVLIGENGAGKSTLMKILAGVEEPTAGRLLLEDDQIEVGSPREALGHGIGIIYQELNLFPNLNVSENIFMARELVSSTGTVRHGEQEAMARTVLARLEQPIDPGTLVGDLRIGQQQLVEIARALAQDVSILIMDEPTSSLSNTETTVLLSLIGELTAQGVSIVYISHKLDECLQIGDVFTVLRDGHLIAEAPAAQVTLEWIVTQMAGRSTAALFPRSDHTITDALLRVENLTLQRPGGGFLLDQVSFALLRGELLGLYGLIGAGRTETAGEPLWPPSRSHRHGLARRPRPGSGHGCPAHRRGAGTDPGGPTVVGSGARALRGAEHDPRQPETLCPRDGALRQERARGRRPADRETGNQGGASDAANHDAERGQPAEGGHRQEPADHAQNIDDGRAHTGHRCRSKGRYFQDHERTCWTGARGAVRVL